MGVIDIKDKSEFDTLIESSKVVIIFCTAEWCGPCKAMDPLFYKHAAEYKERSDSMKFVKVDTDDIPELAQELGFRSIPAFFVFENGEKVDNLAGPNPAALKQLVDRAAEQLE
ncbi:thioredoxin-like protein [Aspergillus parasiticus]|uniref:Thioredoxin n=1 Tax=Aspergillus parasiticus TaxID=5067 RepID=A0A5N6D5E6_ASPPA|nr:thioredoxin-like protein [Aspergillus parasiticus]